LTNDPILVISMIGYKNRYFHVDPDQSGKLVIEMERDVFSLQEVIIRYQNPVEILKKVIDKIPDNYFDDHSTMNGYFREYVQKNNDYVTFSEAVIDISKSPYNNYLQKDIVKIVKGRKLKNLSQEDSVSMKIQSGVNSSLKLDIIKNLPDFLSEDFMDFYHLEFRNIVSYRNQMTYLIAFTPKEQAEYSMYEGELYIAQNTMSLVAADFRINPGFLRKDPNRFLIRKSPLIRIRPLQAEYRVEYRKTEERYHLSMVQAKVNFRLRKKNQWISSLYRIGIEMAITEVLPGIRTKIPLRERLRPGTILADEEFSYDPSFWGDYNIIEPEVSLKEALEKMGINWTDFEE